METKHTYSRSLTPKQASGNALAVGFKAGTGDAHHLINDTNEIVVYLEAGDNSPGDGLTYPDDDLKASLVDGKWEFTHKDGTGY
jgi:uncharacterized cupin superfamily protein